jgi:hypothetical protein
LHQVGLEKKASAMKSQHQQRTETQHRHIPMPEASTDKGRKHEAFEPGSLGSDRRSLARALRFDRKR